MEFEWDDSKRLKNMEKHGLDFEDVYPVFAKGMLIATPDLRTEELRLRGFGKLHREIVCVVFTMRADAIRIISLRKANKREKAKFKAAWGI